MWFDIQNMVKKPLKSCHFINFIKNCEWSFKFWLWCVLEVLHITRDYFSISNKVTLLQVYSKELESCDLHFTRLQHGAKEIHLVLVPIG